MTCSEVRRGPTSKSNAAPQLYNPTRPCIPIRLNQVHCIALLDTGSSHSFINNEIKELLLQYNKKLNVESVREPCVLADNSKVTFVDKVKVNIKIEKFKWVQEFLIFDSMAVDCLLGTDFMRNTGLQLKFDHTSFQFSFNPSMIMLVQDEWGGGQPQSTFNDLAHLPPDQQQKLKSLMRKFPDVLTTKLGMTNKGTCHLTLKDSHPVRSHAYMLAPPKLRVLRNHVNQLLQQGVVIPSVSEYASPCFLVPKKDGGKRLVVDYRKINSKIAFDTFPLPTIETALMNFGGAKIFSVLDLNSAYHQVPLDRESQQYTTFTTPFGSFAYTRLPFGLTVGSQVLSRILANIFSDAAWEFLFLYLDDLVIFSKNFEEHLQHIEFVLQRLRDSGFTVNPDKTSFAATEISYLGYLVSESGVRVNPERVKSIVEYPIPRNLRQVRRFLGMCGFYARFIPHMSELSQPLNALKRKGCKFVWGEDQQNAFNSLKQSLVNPPVLHSPKFEETFILQTDASDRALGAVLQQRVEGHLVPVAFASRLLTPCEQVLSTYAKEALGAIWACEKFSKFLEHNEFVLQTDNQALSWLKAQPHSLGKIGRWVYRLSAFSFRVEHIPAAENVVADSLSRLFEEQSASLVSPILPDFPLSFTSIRQLQLEDEECNQRITKLNQGDTIDKFSVNQDLLVFCGQPGAKKRVVIPESVRPMILKYYHSSIVGGHLGVQKTLHKIAQQFYWPKLKESVTKFVRSCDDCQRAKPSLNTHLGLQASNPSTRPWECIHIDHIGPLPRSTEGNIGILSVLDTFTKFIMLFPIRRIATDLTINVLVTQVFSLFGPPKTMVSDNHAIFLSKAFNDVCFSWGIKHSRTSPYRPQGSHVERFHRNLKSSLIIFSNQNQASWEYYIPYIQTAFNSSWHSSTKCTPSSIFLGREINHPLMLAWNLNLDDPAFLSPSVMQDKWSKALVALKEANLRGARYYNKLRIPNPFKVDDWVLLQSHPQSNAASKFSAKLAQRWLGPFVISQFLTPVTALLRPPLGNAPVRQAHVSSLKKYVSSD